MTLLTEHAIVASPVLLEGQAITLWIGQTVRMETLTAQVAAEEVFLIAESSTQVAHLLKNERWVSERNLDRIRVPACVSFVISCQVIHELLPLLVSW